MMNELLTLRPSFHHLYQSSFLLAIYLRIHRKVVANVCTIFGFICNIKSPGILG